MPYITQSQLDSTVDLPVSLPIADLFPGEWLVVSTVQIEPPQSLTLRWLQAAIFTSDDPAVINSADGSVTVVANSLGECVFPSLAPELTVAGLGLAFIGLYRSFLPLTSPAFQSPQESLLVIGDALSVPPLTVTRSLGPLTLTADGAYSFVICNNTKNRLLRAVVNGQIRASLGLPP